MKKRILVIDDEEAIRKIYSRLFQAVGSTTFDVVTTSNAVEAANFLIRAPGPIDLVLLDIKIPNIDGREIFEIIREYDPNIKIIVASVYPIDKQREMLPQAADYYDKSEGALKLLEKVTNAVF